ncbi:serine/threonine protein kinase [Marinicrinis sediminis]|uniref:non-specific serine/threonine protein kinase n=1 Tax=Marinicrinis sediminis TaxID=1652465 RepID=A0ABW5REA2_9BACL
MKKPSSYQPGDLLAGRYRLIRELGQGGMGAVYAVEDLHLNGKQWAVKIMDADEKLAAESELKLLMELSHPFLPRIVDAIQTHDSQSVIIVMDYIEGVTLQQLFVNQQHQLSDEQLLKWTRQLCEVLDYLHSQAQPVIYRDLKPANIMIDPNDNMKLIDFGISRRYDTMQTSDTRQLGTIGFAAPEQYAGHQSGPRTDLYVLGACLYYLLSGGEHAVPVENEQAESLQLVPDKWRAILYRLLQQNPLYRYANVKQLQQDLRELEGLAGPANPMKRSGHRPKIIAVSGIDQHVGASFMAEAIAIYLGQLFLSSCVLELKGISASMSGADASLLHEEMQLSKRTVKEIYYVNVDWGRSLQSTVDALQDKINGRADMACWVLDLSEHLHLIDSLHTMIDEWVIVADASPRRFNSRHAELAFQKAATYRQKGYSVHFIGNRDPGPHFHAQWAGSFPWKPICFVDNIPYAEWIKAEYQGKHVLSNRDWFETCRECLAPYLQHWQHHVQPKPSRKGWIARMRKNG